jgi:protein gp37
MAAEAARKPATVFCLSLGDIWDKEADPVWRKDLFEMAEATPWLVWLFLSKRIGNAERMCNAVNGDRGLPKNCAIGATMVNQEEWDRDAGKLADAKQRLGARFSFASIEPMLGPIDISRNTPDWIICGGESGYKARVMEPEWAESLLDQCTNMGVPFFMKQMTRKAPIPDRLQVRQVPC